MTVCIAAICDGGSGIVVASDRMVTGVDVEFEQDNLKIDSLTNLCVALTAGSAIEHVDLLRECRSIAQQTTAPAIFDVAEIVKERFVTLRRKRAEELYFSPLGLDIESFFEDQSSLSPDLVLRLVRTLEVEELNLEMVVAGTDNSGGHIYLVHDPGVASCMDALGFCCIGSGEHHATMTFVRTGYSVRTPLHRALYLAYQAKRDAEVAPGVGERFTDLAYINNNELRYSSAELLNGFRAVYDNSRENATRRLEELDEELGDLLKKEAEEDA